MFLVCTAVAAEWLFGCSTEWLNDCFFEHVIFNTAKLYFFDYL